jgi:hypothetical protein
MDLWLVSPSFNWVLHFSMFWSFWEVVDGHDPLKPHQYLQYCTKFTYNSSPANQLVEWCHFYWFYIKKISEGHTAMTKKLLFLTSSHLYVPHDYFQCGKFFFSPITVAHRFQKYLKMKVKAMFEVRAANC